MILTAGGQEYFVRFVYDPYKPDAERRSSCLIRTAAGGIRAGFARCVASDQFSRKSGRKMAFTRAIAGFPRDVRRELWRGYLARFGTR